MRAAAHGTMPVPSAFIVTGDLHARPRALPLLARSLPLFAIVTTLWLLLVVCRLASSPGCGDVPVTSVVSIAGLHADTNTIDLDQPALPLSPLPVAKTVISDDAFAGASVGSSL